MKELTDITFHLISFTVWTAWIFLLFLWYCLFTFKLVCFPVYVGASEACLRLLTFHVCIGFSHDCVSCLTQPNKIFKLWLWSADLRLNKGLWDSVPKLRSLTKWCTLYFCEDYDCEPLSFCCEYIIVAFSILLLWGSLWPFFGPWLVLVILFLISYFSCLKMLLSIQKMGAVVLSTEVSLRVFCF